MDIQIGDFYNENGSSFWDSFWTFISVLLGATIPLLIYYLQTRKETRQKELIKSEENEQKELLKQESIENSLKYFSTLLESIITVAERQVTEYKKHADNLKDFPLDHHLFKSIIAEDLNRALNKLEHEKIFHAYLNKFDASLNRIKIFQQIFSSLDYIDKLYAQANESQKKQLLDLTDRLTKYKDLTEEGLLNFCALLTFKKPKSLESAYYAMLNKLLLDYYKNAPDPITFGYVQEHFVDKLKVEVVRNFYDEEGALHIMENCKKATLLHYEITQKSILVSGEFTEYSEGLGNVVSNLKDQSQDLIMTVLNIDVKSQDKIPAE